MSAPRKNHLRLVHGFKGMLTVEDVRIETIPSESSEILGVARVVEEDTWLIMSASSDIRTQLDHPVRIFTDVLDAEPLLPGSVVIDGESPLRLLAVVHDLGQEPCCRPEWVSVALEEVLAIAERRGLKSLAIPLLGVCYGRLSVDTFAELLVNAVKGSHARCLRAILIIADEEKGGEFLCCARARLGAGIA